MSLMKKKKSFTLKKVVSRLLRSIRSCALYIKKRRREKNTKDRASQRLKINSTKNNLSKIIIFFRISALNWKKKILIVEETLLERYAVKLNKRKLSTNVRIASL